MLYKNAAVVFGLAAAKQAAALGWSTDAAPFSCPGNTINQCSPSQQGGYDWSGLQPGAFSSYGSNDFQGFTCSNNFGKRSVFGKRAFQDKCITAGLDDHPSISCQDGKRSDPR